MALKFVVAVLVLIVLGLGVWDVLVNFESNRCAMTYMFEYPEYIPVRLNPVVRDQFPKYNLFVYGEGDRAREYRRGEFNGLPILFVPGQAGSFRQARSLGSVLLRMSEKHRASSRSSASWDVFTADFREELAALHGNFLQEQTKFVLRCLQRIVDFYPQRKNVRVVLVGHSVGGIVARAVLLIPEMNVSTVDTIITLSTPHRPVFVPDEELQEFYDDVNEYWQRSADHALQDVVLLSLAGGLRDVLVRTERSALSTLFHSHPHFLSAATTSIPEVWSSTDHLCIVWCKQLVLTTARALFDMIDRKTGDVALDIKKRVRVLERYFMNPPSKLIEVRQQNFTRTLQTNYEVRSSPLRLKVKRNDKTSWHLMALERPEDGTLFIRSSFWPSKLKDTTWIGVCDTKSCEDFQALSIKPVRVLWFSEHSHFMAAIPFSRIPAGSVLAVNTAVSRDGFDLVVEESGEDSEFKTVSFGNTIASPMRNVMKEKSYVKFHVDFTEPWEVYHLHIRVINPQCSTERGVVRFSMIGFQQDYYQSIQTDFAIVPLKLQLAKEKATDLATVELLLDPSCSYETTINIAFLEIVGQIVRFYMTQLPAFFIAAAVVDGVQASSGRGPRFVDHLLINGIAVSGFNFQSFLSSHGMDIRPIFEGSCVYCMSVLWMIFYLVGWSLVLLVKSFLRLALRMYSLPVHLVVTPIVWSLRKIENKLPWTAMRPTFFTGWALLASSIAYFTCGENGILLATVLYFIKICYNRRHTESKNLLPAEDREQMYVLLLAVCAALLNAIPGAVWGHSLKMEWESSGLSLFHAARSYYSNMDGDPSFATALLLGLLFDSLVFRQRKDESTLKQKSFSLFARISALVECSMTSSIYVLASLVILFGQGQFYQINLFLRMVFFSISFSSFLRHFVPF